MKVYPGYINYLSEQGRGAARQQAVPRRPSAPRKAFVVYFKVSILCGVVLASPFILYQFWAFVGAGLYPHERKYVYMMFGPSLGPVPRRHAAVPVRRAARAR